MRLRLVLSALCVALIFSLVQAQATDGFPYKVEIVDKVLAVTREKEGKQGLYVTVKFKILRTADNKPALDIGNSEIRVKEEGKPVADLTILQPQSRDLTAMLAMDISGSMRDHGKMDQARKAANTFLDRLDAKADCGVILFNHEMIDPIIPPLRDAKGDQAAHRGAIRKLLKEQYDKPRGGTAYLDAAYHAIERLKGARGRRGVVLMTDGVDLNSTHTLEEVIDLAQANEVPVYTIGVGEPGKNEPVTTVMVLDRSGSMRQPADDHDKIPKIKALHEAAGRFVDIMRPSARTTLIAFSDLVDKPDPFSNDKSALKEKINKLKPRGETALFDAIFQALQTLEAERAHGKRAVVVLTDGEDNLSGHRVEEVIAKAQSMATPLHLLGLGRSDELDEKVMKQMAEQTGGTYHHAANRQKLYETFEDLSIQLHDDGIDETSLRHLADETGGRYIPAHDVSQLELGFVSLAEELQETYTVTFLSRRSSHDGTARDIEIGLWHGDVPLSTAANTAYNV
ncbi:MAG TPA: VWA domain-containing protein, partial [Gemmataceae bacterium]